MVKICEVVDGCEDCPRYGNDCDGDKMTEHTDYISRADAIEAMHEYYQKRFTEDSKWDADAKILVLEDKTIAKDNMEICDIIKALPSADAVQGWIPCSERLPKDLEAVNVTWVNHNPPCYYMDIMNVPFTGVCVHYRDNWYWWDSTICDVLGEYGEQYGAEPIDKDIEVIAWMPLPTPYKGGEDE